MKTYLQFINESFERFFKFDGKPIELHKNPISLKGFPSEVRGLILGNGDLYVTGGDYYTEEILHENIIRALGLREKGSWRVNPKMNDMITVHRLDKTDKMYLGETYTMALFDEEIIKWMKETFELCHKKNPEIEFIYEKITNITESNHINESLNTKIDEFFGNKERLNDVPKVLYHLTSSEYIESVKKNGLLIEKSKPHKFGNGIYLTDDFYTAWNYRFLDEWREDYYIIEIPFNKLDESYMEPDDYETFDCLEDDRGEYEELLDYLGIEEGEVYDNERYLYNTLDYRHSLYICNQLKYMKDISPDKFSKIYNKKEIDEKFEEMRKRK